MKLSVIKDVLFRSIALFMTMALPAIGAGAFAGVEPVNSALIAGALGVSKVLTDLAKAFLDDGKLTQEEVDAVFKRATKKGTDLLTWNIKKYTPVFEEEMPAIESLSIQEPKTNIDDIFDEVMPTGSGKLLGRGKSWNDAGKMYNEILCMRWRT